MAVMENGKSLPERAAIRIKQYITDNKLVVGDKLPNEFQLAELCEVGRSTIREAIKVLIYEGVVEVIRGSGTFITDQADLNKKVEADLDPIGLQGNGENIAQRALQFLDARLIIEPELAAMAADNATYLECQKMLEVAAEVEDCVHRGVDYLEADIKLHTYIARGSHNKVLQNMTELLVKGIPIFIEVTHNVNAMQTLECHRSIISSIMNGDARGARCAMITHLNMNRQLIMNAAEKEKEKK